ncbi:MAG: hypothetical protein QOG87_3000, partial [Actinomycetota bacterium]
MCGFSGADRGARGEVSLMRRILATATAVAMVLGTVSLLGPARAADPDPSQVGSFGKAFREDGNPESEDTAGCGDGTTCLPTAASVNVLPNGKVLYWNALEGTESIPLNAVLEGADLTLDDQTRVLTLNESDPAKSTWDKSEPLQGGANPDGNTESDVGAPADAAKNDGDMFCTTHVHLPDGRLMVMGGTDYYQDPRLTPEPGYGVIELEGLKASRTFNPATSSWVKAGSMNWGRWYPSALTLADGDIFVASGVTKLIKPLYTDQKNLPNS